MKHPRFAICSFFVFNQNQIYQLSTFSFDELTRSETYSSRPPQADRAPGDEALHQASVPFWQKLHLISCINAFKVVTRFTRKFKTVVTLLKRSINRM